MSPKTTTPQAAPAGCPIGPDVDKIVEHSGNLRRSLQKLRHDLTHCTACPHGPECINWTAYQATVRQAINDVAREWHQ